MILQPPFPAKLTVYFKVVSTLYPEISPPNISMPYLEIHPGRQPAKISKLQGLQMPQRPLDSLPDIHSDSQPAPEIQATINSPRFPGINTVQVELF